MKMKINQLFKKATALLLTAITALSIFPTTITLAAPGDTAEVFFTRTYDTAGNEILYNSSAVFNGYTEGGTGTYKYRMYINGSTNAFCLQPGVPLSQGSILEKSASEAWNSLSFDQKKAIGLALLYGVQGNAGNLKGNDDERWIATQTLIWEFTNGGREVTAPYNQISQEVYQLHFGSNYANDGAREAYEQIVAFMTRHNTIPSFMSRNASEITRDLSFSDGKYRITLTDNHDILSEYTFSSSNPNISIEKSGNTLTLSSSAAIDGNAQIIARRNNIPVVSESATLVAYGDPYFQDLITGVENADRIAAYINIKTTTGNMELKKVSEDGIVANIQFTITGSNNYNKTITTDKDGMISLKGLVPGTYTITETTYNHYEPQNSQTITIIGGQTSTVTFSNTMKRGALQIVKNSEDGMVEGIWFHLYGTSLSGVPVDEYAITDSNGIAKFTNLLISENTPYIVEEVDTAIRYVIPNSQTVSIEWEKAANRTFVNVLKKFRVSVTKSDAESIHAQGNASLVAATYGIYKGEELIDTYTTDDKGTFTTKYYTCDDDWTIQEIKAPEGYLLDATIHKIGAKAELYTLEYNTTTKEVVEQVIKGNIAIIKHSDNGETQIETPEEGAIFEIYLKSAGSYANAVETERDILICDEHGFAQSKDLPYGIYTVHQTSGWEGREFIKDFDVFINLEGQTYRYLINNANFKSYIKIVKKDAETGNTIPYAGAGFQLYDPSGNLVTMTFTYPQVTTIDTFYTTIEGELITPQMLEYGVGYSLVEVQAPYGYVLNPEPVKFDVTKEESTEESGITMIEVIRSNMAQKGTITISKSGELFSSVTENGGLYKPIYKVSGLAGATYEIIATEDIYTLDGTLRAMKDEVVDTITTIIDGTVTSKELYLGKYRIKEISAPIGMLLNKEPQDTELTYAGQEIAITETATSLYNERQRVAIDLKKSLEINERYGIGDNGELFDTTFGLYAANDLTAVDGTTIPTDGLIEIITLDENGYGNVTTDLPLGNYYMREVSTNAAYLISAQRYPVIFKYAGQDTEIVQITVNEGESIENKIIYGSVSGKKFDEDGNVLAGALIGIFKSEITEYTKETAIATTTSIENGSFSFSEVPYGTWIIREIESPKAFVLSEEEIIVTINEVEQVVEIELINYFITGEIELTKVDKDFPDNHLSGAEFEIFIDTNQNEMFDKEDELVGKMSEFEGGVYKMSDLRHGLYFVKEKTAPEGFVLDESVYPVFIEKDGEAYLVENEAGVGFINMAQVGKLKIIKTSSDGKKEGFSFQVTGVGGYDQTFQTDANGEIFIEDLRIGEYTVSEIKDKVSARYLLPVDKQVMVTVESTTIIQMHNQLIETPKTGDDFNPIFWGGLVIVGVIGAGVTGFIGFKKKKETGQSN